MSQPTDRTAPSRRALIAGGLASGALSACSPLGLVNAITPAAGGSRVLARDVAYGPDPRHRLDVYAPATQAGPAPVMAFILGGGWNEGNKAEFEFVGRAFAARGFVTVIPDYRLVPQVRFPGFVEDCALAMAAVQARAAEWGGDVGQVHLSGHSAGAYNAVMLVLDPRFGAAAGLRPGLVRSVAGLAGPYDFLPLDDPRTVAAFSQYEPLAKTQPVNFARRTGARFLLATGDDDTTVFPRNSVALDKRLRAAGAASRLKRYPGVTHAGILLALGSRLAGDAPVLEDVVNFALGRG